MKQIQLLYGFILCGSYTLLALLVHHRVFASIDLAATAFLQQLIPRFADLPSSILSLLGSVEITVPTFAFLVMLSHPAIRVRLVLLFALIALVELQGKAMIEHPGVPDELLRYIFAFGTPTGSIHTTYSFPSGHAARASFLVTLAIALISQSQADARTRRALTALLLVASAAMLVSRVYIGDHWMTDVIGGALLGVGLALFSVEPKITSAARRLD